MMGNVLRIWYGQLIQTQTTVSDISGANIDVGMMRNININLKVSTYVLIVLFLTNLHYFKFRAKLFLFERDLILY